MAGPADCPLALNGRKLSVLMARRPNVAMMASGTNFTTLVHSCTAPMFFTPERLTTVGSHSPASAMTIDHPRAPSLLMKCST
jgi:hypothetical protein